MAGLSKWTAVAFAIGAVIAPVADAQEVEKQRPDISYNIRQSNNDCIDAMQKGTVLSSSSSSVGETLRYQILMQGNKGTSGGSNIYLVVIAGDQMYCYSVEFRYGVAE